MNRNHCSFDMRPADRFNDYKIRNPIYEREIKNTYQNKKRIEKQILQHWKTHKLAPPIGVKIYDDFNERLSKEAGEIVRDIFHYANIGKYIYFGLVLAIRHINRALLEIGQYHGDLYDIFRNRRISNFNDIDDLLDEKTDTIQKLINDYEKQVNKICKEYSIREIIREELFLNLETYKQALKRIWLQCAILGQAEGSFSDDFKDENFNYYSTTSTI